MRLAACALLALCASGARSDEGSGGNETKTDRVVNSNAAWTVLVSKSFSLASDDDSCVVIGSAEAINPNNGNDRQYRFSLAIDNSNPGVDNAFERLVEFDANTVGREEVTSTATFRLLQSGNHTIYWLARKISGAPNLTVSDNSMSLVCASSLLDPIDGRGDGN